MIPLEITGIPSLRVTEVQGFEACPRMWSEQRFGNYPKRESPYAAMGTAVHRIIELFITNQLTAPWRDVEKWLRSQGVNAEECENCYQYLDKLRCMGLRVIAVEHAFQFDIIPGCIPLTGHIDVAAVGPTSALVVLDHKTNRQSEPTREWERKLQPVLYSWAARRLWPGYTTQKFIIGYVNLGKFVEWDVDIEKNENEATQRYLVALQEMQEGRREGASLPERIHSGCRYCPAKRTCKSLNDLGDSVLVRQLGGLP